MEKGRSASAACLIVLPWLRLSSAASVGSLCCRSWAALRNTSPRTRGGDFGQGPRSNA